MIGNNKIKEKKIFLCLFLLSNNYKDEEGKEILNIRKYYDW
jgi:hypothetical protein